MNHRIELLLDSLTPSDIGCVNLGSRMVRFEGFTDECWFDAVMLRKSRHSLETEILDEWFQAGETEGKQSIDNGWWTPDIFYAIYESR